jgi:hypothetical protein
MNTATLDASNLIIAAIRIYAVILVILWTLVPFAVFGIKNRLDRLIVRVGRLVDETERQGNRLKRIADGLESQP